MWAVYERLGNDSHIKHECATASKKITKRMVRRVRVNVHEKTYGMLSMRYKYDIVGESCILGEESIDKT